MAEIFTAAFWAEYGGILAEGVWDTLLMTGLSTLLAYLIGLPLGILLVTGEQGGIRPMPKMLMNILNVAVNLLRSIPFLILWWW